MSADPSSDRKLPIHGFVLAGGKSSRMGQDKALLTFAGRPMVEIAVEKLRSFCAEVSIVGERPDLAAFAGIVSGERPNAGPAAGFEAGLRASRHPWTLFIPVDVPLVPADLLHRWADAVIENPTRGASLLLVRGERQPAFSMLHKRCAAPVSSALDKGERKLADLLYAADEADAGWLWPVDASCFAPQASDVQMEFWFSNVNTPHELAEAEAWDGSTQKTGPMA